MIYTSGCAQRECCSNLNIMTNMKLAHTIISVAEFIMAALVIAVIFMISCSWKCLFLGIILYCIPKMVSVFHIMWDEALNEENY